MNKKKILEFIKKNKVSVGIVGAILSVSILTGVGFGIHKLTSSDNNSLAVAENEDNKQNDTIQSNNATASLNKDEQAINESVENQNNSENDNKDTNSSNDSKSDNKETGSENTKKDDEKKNDNNTSSSDKKVSVDIKTEGGQGTSSNSGSNTQTPSNNHSHSWTPIKKTVHHKEQGHYENVLVKPAWTEKVPVYEEREVMICNDCGVELSTDDKIRREHIRNHILNGGKGSWREEWRNVQVGTKTVKHEAVYKKKWVVDKKAYDETIITGYKCSCGATK